ATVEYNYSVGAVNNSSSEFYGGLAGDSDITLETCYYDQETSGQSDDSGKGIPKTTAEMKQEATYQGWDFSGTWMIDEDTSYPYLRDNQQEPVPQ
ncbi:MAG: hypothetical protein ACOCRZ_00995, partial [Halothermotrichaceae bacterium]